MSPVDASFKLAPKALNGIEMNVAASVFFKGMVDTIMVVAHRTDPVIGVVLVSHDIGADFDAVSHNRKDGGGFGISNYFGLDLPLPFYHAKNWGFVFRSTAPFAMFSSAHVGFVKFNRVGKLLSRLAEKLSDLFGHAPSRFVGDSELAFQLLGGHPILGVGKKIYSIEPAFKRGLGFVKDGIRKRVKLVSAILAGIAFAARDAVEPSLLMAGWACL